MTTPTFDIHQSHAGALGRGYQIPPLLDRRCNRLLDEDVNVAGNAGECYLMMKMGRRGNRHGIDALRDQFIQTDKAAATDEVSGTRAMFRQRVDDTDQRHVRQTRQHARMIAAHDAGTDDADTQRTSDANPSAGCRIPGTHIRQPQQTFGGNVPAVS
jgi:hypothetical protein